MNPELKKKIEAEAEKLYPPQKGKQWVRALRDAKIKSHIEAAAPYAEKCEKLAEALELAEMELKAMYDRIGFKGSNVLSKIQQTLTDYEG